MSEKHFDFTILTDHRWVNPETIDDYAANVLLEDKLLLEGDPFYHDKLNEGNHSVYFYDLATKKFSRPGGKE